MAVIIVSQRVMRVVNIIYYSGGTVVIVGDEKDENCIDLPLRFKINQHKTCNWIEIELEVCFAKSVVAAHCPHNCIVHNAFINADSKGDVTTRRIIPNRNMTVNSNRAFTA
jgi:hypothetical protein